MAKRLYKLILHKPLKWWQYDLKNNDNISYLIHILQAFSPSGHSPVMSFMIANGITNIATFNINFLLSKRILSWSKLESIYHLLQKANSQLMRSFQSLWLNRFLENRKCQSGRMETSILLNKWYNKKTVIFPKWLKRQTISRNTESALCFRFPLVAEDFVQIHFISSVIVLQINQQVRGWRGRGLRVSSECCRSSPPHRRECCPGLRWGPGGPGSTWAARTTSHTSRQERGQILSITLFIINCLQ